MDCDILIVNVPTIKHEIACRRFNEKLIIKAVGTKLEDGLINISATIYKTPRVSEERDSAFKPPSVRPREVD